MPYADFYNLNENIVYPFVPPGTGEIRFQLDDRTIPDAFIVDCGFWLDSDEDYDPETDIIYLDTLSRSGSALTIVFTATSGASFSFVRYDSDLPGAVSYAESGGSVAFLVTGSMDILSLLSDGESVQIYRFLDVAGVLQADAVVEPALVQAETGTSLLSLTIGNLGAIQDKPCGGCGTAADIDNTVYVQDGGLRLTGDITFAPGYSMIVSLSELDSVITFTSSYGAGEGALCGAPPSRYPADDPDAGERCGDLLYTINGIAPTENGAFSLQGSIGVGVESGGANEVLVIGQIERTIVCSPDE